MSDRFRTSTLVVPSVLAFAVFVAGCGGGSKVQTVHVQTEKPHTKTLDFPPKGKSPGDLYVFDATVLAADGRTVIGRLRGTQTDIKLEHGVETVQGMLTYQLGGGDSIVIGGLSEYPLTATGLVKGKTYVRPVIGGTGKYAGAKGTVTSQRLSGDRYNQEFRLTH